MCVHFRAAKDRYLCRCRSASFFRRTRAAQSGQYLARLDFGVNTAPHSTQRFTSSRLLLISAHRAASSSELAMAKSVRKNAQPQIENLCSKGAWGRGPQQARGAIWIATSIACLFSRRNKISQRRNLQISLTGLLCFKFPGKFF